ncbi:MAG TPA: iron uptake porin [Candidatus Caenarcaniphilales bacterium]
MSKVLWNVLLATPATLGASMAVAMGALAEIPTGSLSGAVPAPEVKVEVLEQEAQLDNANQSLTGQEVLSQAETAPPAAAPGAPGTAGGGSGAPVTAVSQLSDVQPGDWAFQSLQALIERYGCIAGYPDGTYRGNRPTTRYEFAAGLYACLNSLAERLQPEDLAAVRRLQEEFAAELATLRGQVDALDARTTEVEANQFSTTTKLNGEVVFGLANAFGGDRAVATGAAPTTADVGDNTIFANRTRLNFDTSFTGKDRLRTRLQAGNVPNLTTATGTRMARLGYDTNTNNQLELGRLEYRFPVGDKGEGHIGITGSEFNEIFETLNPYLESSGKGSISRFGRFNPIYRISGDTGATFNYEFGKAVVASIGYLAANANETESGLFGGSYGALAQLAFKPTETINLGLTYVRSYTEFTVGTTGATSVVIPTSGGTGSAFANAPFGTGVATTANSYGGEASLQLSKNFSVGGWVGYTQASAETGPDADANIFNYAVNLAFPDLGKEGNLGAIIFGQPPKVTRNDIAAREDGDTSFHVEGLYRFQVSDNISVTPGIIWVTNPEHNAANDDVFVGTIRTTFTF